MPSDARMLVVVDDDAEVRTALARLVSVAGYRVESFASGAEFLRSIEQRSPDCIVLDLHMPGMSGFDVQRTLAELHSTVPVVAITGHDSCEARSRAISLGAKAYLCKPIDDEALLGAIGGAIGSTDA